MQRHPAILLVVGLVAFLLGGCASVATYAKPNAPWSTIQKVAVMPFTLPSENLVRRQLMTQLFAEELRRAGVVEVTEVPLPSTVGVAPKVEEVARTYQVDAVFSGSVDETQGTVIHLWAHDAATGEILWSGTYLLGIGSEYMSLRSQQQQIQRAFGRLVKEFTESRGASAPQPKKAS